MKKGNYRTLKTVIIIRRKKKTGRIKEKTALLSKNRKEKRKMEIIIINVHKRNATVPRQMEAVTNTHTFT